MREEYVHIADFKIVDNYIHKGQIGIAVEEGVFHLNDPDVDEDRFIESLAMADCLASLFGFMEVTDWKTHEDFARDWAVLYEALDGFYNNE